MCESQPGHFCVSCILSCQHSCAMTLVSVTPSRVHMRVWPCGTLRQYFDEHTDLSTATFEHHEKQSIPNGAEKINQIYLMISHDQNGWPCKISKWLAIIHHYVLCSIYPLVIKHVDGKSPMDNFPSKTSIDKGFPSRVWLPQGQLFLAWLYNYVATTSTGSGWQRVFAKCLAGEQLPTALLVNEQQRVFRLLLHCCLRIVLDLAMMISVKNGRFRHIWTKNLRTYAVFINNSSWISYAQVLIVSANFK